jgi:hypothetical protein
VAIHALPLVAEVGMSTIASTTMPISRRKYKKIEFHLACENERLLFI